jgi:hypothetical protein
MASATYTEMTRADLTGWDKESIDLIMDAQELGWTGRRSSKGHVILSAPDGTTTMSVSRRWSNGRSGPNMRSNLTRWVRNQEMVAAFAAVDEADESRRKEMFLENMQRALADLNVEGAPTHEGEVMLQVYSIALDRPKVAEFAFETATENRVSDFGFLSSFPDDEEPKPWTVQWLVWDKRDRRLIDYAGPKFPDGSPWDESAAYLAIMANDAVDEPDVEEAKPFVCDECGRRFPLAMNLGRHMRAHERRAQAAVPQPVVPEPAVQEPTVTEPTVQEPPVDNPAPTQGAAEAMQQAMENLGVVALRMALLEDERAQYETRVAEMESTIARLTTERDNAVGSLSALKALISEA